MSACCHHEAANSQPWGLRRWAGRASAIANWLLPAAALAVMPKCPLCLAAYIAIWTGIGLTLATATYLWKALIAACVLSLICSAIKYAGRAAGFIG